LDSNSIEEQWDANWCKRYWKHVANYDVEAVHVGAVKRYVAAVKALIKRKRGWRRQDEFSLPQRLMCNQKRKG
jgi:hypothetical protein